VSALVTQLRAPAAPAPLIGVTGPRIHAAEIASTPGILAHAFTDTAYAFYAQALARAGALPVLLPRENDADAVVRRLDAVVIAGGQDVDPRLYGDLPTPTSTRLDPERDAFELALIDAALAHDRPLLGICRGAQLLNVALGGTLIGDLAPVQRIEHTLVLYPPDARVHPVEFEPGCALASVYGDSTVVNSFHRQAVGRLGDRVVACGRAPDGVIEAIEVTGARAVGVQWHPEMLADDRLPAWLVAQARGAHPQSAPHDEGVPLERSR
jgi:putative glutamine amidotransferase